MNLAKKELPPSSPHFHPFPGPPFVHTTVLQGTWFNPQWLVTYCLHVVLLGIRGTLTAKTTSVLRLLRGKMLKLTITTVKTMKTQAYSSMKHCAKRVSTKQGKVIKSFPSFNFLMMLHYDILENYDEKLKPGPRYNCPCHTERWRK